MNSRTAQALAKQVADRKFASHAASDARDAEAEQDEPKVDLYTEIHKAWLAEVERIRKGLA